LRFTRVFEEKGKSIMEEGKLSYSPCPYPLSLVMKMFMINQNNTATGGNIPFCNVCQGKLMSIISGDGEHKENYCPRCKKMFSSDELSQLRQ
jgi:hypothetical protein